MKNVIHVLIFRGNEPIASGPSLHKKIHCRQAAMALQSITSLSFLPQLLSMIWPCLQWPSGIKGNPTLSGTHYTNQPRWRHLVSSWPPLSWFTKVSNRFLHEDSKWCSAICMYDIKWSAGPTLGTNFLAGLLFTFHATGPTDQQLTIDLFWKLTLFWYSGWNVHVIGKPKWIEWLLQGDETLKISMSQASNCMTRKFCCPIMDQLPCLLYSFS